MPKYWNESLECAKSYEMAALQSFRLSQIVRRVYENVPHYRQKMEEIGIKPEDIKSVDDLNKLPFTTKQDLRDTYPYGLFAVPMEEVVRVHASSGTTGKQIVVGYTKNDVGVWEECTARAITAAGGGKHDFMRDLRSCGVGRGCPVPVLAASTVLPRGSWAYGRRCVPAVWRQASGCTVG